MKTKIAQIDGLIEALESKAPFIHNHDMTSDGGINAPESTTIALDKSTKVLTVTDSYASPSDLELGGESLYNALVNGDFGSGVTGWEFTSCNPVVTAKVLSISGNGANNSYFAGRSVGISKIGNKYFVKAKVRVTNANCLNLYVSLRKGSITGASLVGFTQIVNPVQNQWYNVFFIVTGDDASNLYTGFACQYLDNATQNGKIMEVDGNAGVFTVPMTGTPYEAYTADEMNGLANQYVDKLQGAKTVVIGSRGRNLFDFGKLATGSYVDLNPITKVARVYGHASYRLGTSITLYLKPNTTYKYRHIATLGGTATGQYFTIKDLANGVAIASITSAVGISEKTFNSGSGKVILSYSRNGGADDKLGWVDISDIMLNEGLSYLPVEPYQGSQVTISATRHKLPNLVEDELKFVDGKWVFVKRTAETLLVSADITSLVTTFTSVDLVTISKKADALAYNDANLLTDISKQFMLLGFNPKSSLTDSATDVGSFSNNNATTIAIAVTKGTYANLAAAQAALAGTKVVYQLATPLVIEEQDFGTYGITVEGSLSSNLDYTEYFIVDHDIMTDMSIDYATNLAKAIEQLKDNVNGLNNMIDSFDDNKGWVVVPLVGGATGYMRCKKDKLGNILLRFSIVPNTVTSDTTFCTLPEGYRAFDYMPIQALNLSNAKADFHFYTDTYGYFKLTANGGFIATDALRGQAIFTPQ